MKISKEISKHYSKLGKLSHKKSPRSKEFYSKMGKKGGGHNKKELSPPTL